MSDGMRWVTSGLADVIAGAHSTQRDVMASSAD